MFFAPWLRWAPRDWISRRSWSLGRAGLAAAALLGSALTAGCGASEPQDLTVHWLLADGRSCIDAAVVIVMVSAEGGAESASPSSASVRCPAAPGATTQLVIPGVFPGARLRGSGLSASNSVLYRGETTVPNPALPTLDLVLYFTGGQ